MQFHSHLRLRMEPLTADANNNPVEIRRVAARSVPSDPSFAPPPRIFGVTGGSIALRLHSLLQHSACGQDQA